MEQSLDIIFWYFNFLFGIVDHGYNYILEGLIGDLLRGWIEGSQDLRLVMLGEKKCKFFFHFLHFDGEYNIHFVLDIMIKWLIWT